MFEWSTTISHTPLCYFYTVSILTLACVCVLFGVLSVVLCVRMLFLTFHRCDFLFFHIYFPTPFFLCRLSISCETSFLHPSVQTLTSWRTALCLRCLVQSYTRHDHPPPQWRAHGFCTWQRSPRTKSYSSEKHRTRVSCLMNRDINQECNLLSQIHSDGVMQKKKNSRQSEKALKALWRKSVFKINTNWWENSGKRSAERKPLCTTYLSPDAGLIAAVWEQLLPSQP